MSDSVDFRVIELRFGAVQQEAGVRHVEPQRRLVRSRCKGSAGAVRHGLLVVADDNEPGPEAHVDIAVFGIVSGVCPHHVGQLQCFRFRLLRRVCVGIQSGLHVGAHLVKVGAHNPVVLVPLGQVIIGCVVHTSFSFKFDVTGKKPVHTGVYRAKSCRKPCNGGINKKNNILPGLTKQSWEDILNIRIGRCRQTGGSS